MEQAQPKYRMIANYLLREIRSGQLPVGSFLPTENDLMLAYGVSRHTARKAVQSLKMKGIVHSRQGSGSMVVRDGREAALVEEVQSIGELVAFGQSTRRKLISSKIVSAGPDLVQMFGCQEGRRFVQVEFLRQTTTDESKSIALVKLWMDVLFESAIPKLTRLNKSAAEIIADSFGRPTEYVVQTVEADLLSDRAARLLGTKPGLPSLNIKRDYCVAPGTSPHLIATSVYPGHMLKIVSKFRGAQSMTDHSPGAWHPPGEDST